MDTNDAQCCEDDPQPAAARPNNCQRPTAAVPPRLVSGIFLALLAWGLYLAIGASFPKQGNVLDDPQSLLDADELRAVEGTSPGADAAAATTEDTNGLSRYRPQPQRGLVVAACFAIFLAWFWWLQRLYQKRHPRG